MMVNATQEMVEKQMWVCGECGLDWNTQEEADACCSGVTECQN